MNKKQFLKQKYEDFQRRIWNDEIEKLYAEFLLEKLEKELEELTNAQIIYKSNEDPTKVIRKREEKKNALKSKIEEIRNIILALEKRIEDDKEFLEIFKKRI